VSEEDFTVVTVWGQSNMDLWGHRSQWSDGQGNVFREDIPWDPGFNSYRTVNGKTRRIAGKILLHDGRKP